MKIVTGREFAKALERRGWTLARVNGSHHIYKAPAGFGTVSVPIHNKDLLIGTQRTLMRQSGLTDADL